MTAFSAQARRAALNDLIELACPVGEAVRAVRELPWDSESELVSLSRANMIALLQRYLLGELSPIDLEAWANAVEGRDDIGAEPECEGMLRAFVYETANPALIEPITGGYARRWLERLTGS